MSQSSQIDKLMMHLRVIEKYEQDKLPISKRNKDLN